MKEPLAVPQFESALREAGTRLGNRRVLRGRLDPIRTIDLARPIEPVQPVR